MIRDRLRAAVAYAARKALGLPDPPARSRRALRPGHRGGWPARRLRGVYDGTEHSRQTADWNAYSGEPRALTASWLTMLRARSRSLGRTAPHVVSAFDAIRDNVIGAEGYRLRPMPHASGDVESPDERLGKNLRALWQDHSAAIDIDRRESLSSMLRTALREYPEAGEMLVVESTPRSDPDGIVPQVIELVPSERLPIGLTAAIGIRNSDIPEGHYISNSIEFDPDHRRAAYHFTKLDRVGVMSFETERIPAARVHHLFHRLRSGQERGLPWLYASTLLAHDLDDLIDSELTSAQVAACLAAFVQQESGAGPFDDPTAEKAEDGRPVQNFDPGMVAYLRPGETVQTVDPTRPGNTFDSFASFLVRMLGKSLGPAYETISGDYRQVNFASGRLAHLVERKAYRRIQADVRDLVVRPIYRSFVRAAILAGRVQIRASEYVADPRRFDRVDIQPPGWEHVDPLKEVTAAALRILVGLTTLDEEAGALGKDWQANIEQRAREIKRMEAAGMPIVSVGGASPLQGMTSANSTNRMSGTDAAARLEAVASDLGFSDAGDLIDHIEGGALDAYVAANGRLSSMRAA